MQNTTFVLKRLLQWDFHVVHRSARSRGYRSVEAQGLADDGFEVGERIELLHGRRIGRAGAQLGTKLGLDSGLARECEKCPGNCGATTQTVDCVSNFEVWLGSTPRSFMPCK